LESLRQGFVEKHSSKKVAKKMAAYAMVSLYLGGFVENENKD
jgi:hypothetical protein